MKRRDLKPGDLFTYADTPGVYFWVPSPGKPGPPSYHTSVNPALYAHQQADGTPAAYDDDVVLIASDVERDLKTADGDFKLATAAKKVPLEMLPLRALQGVARVFQHGAKKYAPGNYLKATIADGAPGRYVGALLRHGMRYQGLDGQFDPNDLAKVDEESGLPEIDHMLAGLMMLRAILTKEGKLPEDPGESKYIL